VQPARQVRRLGHPAADDHRLPLAASTPYLGVILLIVVLAWLAAASSLNKQARSGTRRVKNPPDSI